MSSAALAELAREFARREVAPRSAEVDRTGTLPADLFPRLGDSGLLGLLAPEEFGGTGQDVAAVAAVIEPLAGACGSTAWTYLAHCCAVAAVSAHGSPALKERCLADLVRGRLVGAVAGTEDTGGSNPMGIRTTARADGDGYVLDGAKVFITGAGEAGLFVLLARTGDQPGPGALSVFAVPAGLPGVSFGRREETLGVRGASVGEVRLEDCRVGAGHLVGAPGGGLAVLAAVGGCGVVGAAAAAVGLAQAAVDLTRTHLLERQVMGKPLAAVPGVQQIWAGILMDMEGARALADRAVQLALVPGPPMVPWLAKVQVTETALRIIDRCLQLHGASGFTRALPLERLYRDARPLCIHWGNNDVLRANAGAMALGQM